MSKSLEDYISFLPREGQYTIDIAREESQEPLSVLSAIHWVAHHEEVEETLGRLLIHEVNAILKRLNNSNNSTLTAKSAASLSLTPDKCLDICFSDWEDYGEIQKATRTLERFLGRKVYLRPNHQKWPSKKSLIVRLHEDSEYRRTNIKEG
jgi:hypothetical protein|tara:strand:- start:16380 stop:16832 length:453 start_codon:yes stop_codon:yes gene_type:complete